MLRELHIENVAIIEKADIEFYAGFNVMTGETGAGKSIVLDALNAVLGGRTSRELVRHGADKAAVRAVFDSDVAEQWLEENEIDREDELILQRRIQADGKNSCRVNGIPVSVAQLRELGSLLLNIHGQNDGRLLLDEARHLDYLDAFGEYSRELELFRESYSDYRTAVRKMNQLVLDEEEKQRLIESLEFRVAELSKANLQAGEEEQLESRAEIMRNSEKLSEKSRIILNFINVKLIHDLCQRFKHLACLIKLRHIHAVEDHIRRLGNLLCGFRTKRYNGIHIIDFNRADNIVHFF